jgi:hypothetical protein
MKFSRRRFLLGASIVAICAATPVLAGLHGHGSASGFNGGRSQVNLDSLQFAFLDLMKTGPNWNNGGGVNANAQVTPANMDVNGYPTTIGTNGYYTTIFIPPTTIRPGNYVFRWTGGDVTTTMRNPGTLVSGSVSGANGRFVFTPNASATAQNPQFGPTVLGTPYVSSMSLMHVNDEAAWLAGQVFGTQFKAVLAQANFGVIRFLNQQPSQANLTTWATRKPVGYFSYVASEYRASLWAGQTTNVGNDYSITFGSGAPVDKQTILLQFNAAATLNTAVVTFPGASTINWTAHGLVAGDVVGFNGGSPPTGIFYGGTYYVIAAGLTANAFQISLTRGGAAYSYGAGASGTTVGVRIPTLNLNSTGTVAIMSSSAATITGIGDMPAVNAGGSSYWATLVYDADLNSWIMNGGTTNQGSAGVENACPYEIMLQLCKEIGAHPHFVAPFLAVDPMTDFYTQLSTYIKNNMPSWMIPRFETCNECWNNNNPMTQYAFQKAYVHWNTQFSGGIFNNHNWVGKTASTIGQAVNAVYGGAIGVGYRILIGVQTVDFSSPGANSSGARFTAANYVAQSAAAQVGYTKTAASLWVTHGTLANYFNPSERDTGQEATDAATFASNAAQIVGSISGGTLTVASVTNGTLVIGQTINDQYGLIPAGVTITAGSGTSWTVSNSAFSVIAGTIIFALNSTARTLATSYADTAGGAANNNNLAGVKVYYTNFGGYLATLINSASNALKMTFYEGGYSPDTNSTTQINALRNASKMVADVGLLISGGTLASAAVVAGNYADCISTGGEFPSLFQLAGTNNIWSVLDPDIYASPQTAQWLAIVAANH